MNVLLLAAATMAPGQFAPPDTGRVRRYGIDFGADIQLEFRSPRVYRYPDPPRAMPYAGGNGGGYPTGYGNGCGGGYAAPGGYGYGTGPAGRSYSYSYGNGAGAYGYGGPATTLPAYPNGNGGGYYAAPGGYGGGVGPAGRSYSYSYGGNGYAAAPATFETRQRRPGPDGY